MKSDLSKVYLTGNIINKINNSNHLIRFSNSKPFIVDISSVNIKEITVNRFTNDDFMIFLKLKKNKTNKKKSITKFESEVLFVKKHKTIKINTVLFLREVLEKVILFNLFKDIKSVKVSGYEGIIINSLSL
jgi:hypothetical protein